MTQVRQLKQWSLKKNGNQDVIQSSSGLKSEFSRCLDKIPVKIVLDAHGLLCMV